MDRRGVLTDSAGWRNFIWFSEPEWRLQKRVEMRSKVHRVQVSKSWGRWHRLPKKMGLGFKLKGEIKICLLSTDSHGSLYLHLPHSVSCSHNQSHLACAKVFVEDILLKSLYISRHGSREGSLWRTQVMKEKEINWKPKSEWWVILGTLHYPNIFLYCP